MTKRLGVYRLAAEQGIAGAQCRLGVMYAEGQGVKQDDSESVRRPLARNAMHERTDTSLSLPQPTVGTPT